ncbi:MAG: sensor histidine kinase [Planctomycetota bacterium]|nr:MAG: sensor histidine kinase [Planctomycetota bacterium]
MPPPAGQTDDPGPAEAAAVPADDLARMVAHEVRNLLTPVRVRAQLALEALDTEAVGADALTGLIRAADQIAAVTDAILERAPAHAESTDLLGAVREAASLAGVGGIRVEGDGAPIEVAASRVALRHILINLLLNAARASDDGAGITVRIERSTWNGRDSASVAVLDHGGGLPPAALARLNDDTAEPASPGVGLEVVRRLARAICAGLEARNTGDGAEITIRLPLAVQAAEPARASAGRPAA